MIKAGQIAGALTAVITAGVLIWNLALKPAPAPAELVAHVTDVQAHPGVTEYTYLRAIPGSSNAKKPNCDSCIHNWEPPLTQREIDQALRQPGAEVQWRIFLEGPVGRRFELTHTLFRENAGEKTVIADELGSIWPSERIVSQAVKYENTEGAWIQTPPGVGTYVIESIWPPPMEVKTPKAPRASAWQGGDGAGDRGGVVPPTDSDPLASPSPAALTRTRRRYGLLDSPVGVCNSSPATRSKWRRFES